MLAAQSSVQDCTSSVRLVVQRREASLSIACTEGRAYIAIDTRVQRQINAKSARNSRRRAFLPCGADTLCPRPHAHPKISGVSAGGATARKIFPEALNGPLNSRTRRAQTANRFSRRNRLPL